ncbi:hypothetical protein F4776DRAFT_673111 [Hypoxylon sp. NC0597]|nr:hypothetical protein F4776DRAFT_673111 [Hypoxylon sp. NC0597]
MNVPMNEDPHGGTGENAASSSGGNPVSIQIQVTLSAGENPSSVQFQVTLSAGGNPSSVQTTSQLPSVHDTRLIEARDGNNNTDMGGVNQPSHLTSASAAALTQSRWANGNQQADQSTPKAPSQPHRRPPVPKPKVTLGDASKPSGVQSRRRPPPSRPSGQPILDLSTRSSRAEQTTSSPATSNHSAPIYLPCSNGQLELVGDGKAPVLNEVRKLNDNTVAGYIDGPERLAEAFSAVSTLTSSSARRTPYLFLLQEGSTREQRQEENRRLFFKSGATTFAQRRRPPPAPEPEYCGNCDLPGHTLGACVTHWTGSGDINGCYRCNRYDHMIDDCSLLPRTPDSVRFQTEVVNRAGRPPLRSRRGWNELAIAHGYDGLGPISRQGMIMVPRTHFNNWNYALSAEEQSNLLVRDEATQGLAAIRTLEDQRFQPPVHPFDMRSRSKIDNRPRRKQPPSRGPAATTPTTQAHQASQAPRFGVTSSGYSASNIPGAQYSVPQPGAPQFGAAQLDGSELGFPQVSGSQVSGAQFGGPQPIGAQPNGSQPGDPHPGDPHSAPGDAI